MDALGAEAAGKIGAAFKDGKIDKTAQLIAHAALGGAMAAADGKDAVSGAVGAVVGEVAAELLVSKFINNQLEDPDKLKSLTPQEKEQFCAEIDQLKQSGVDLSKLAAGIVAATAGLDVNTAARTGGNAAQHNELITLAVCLELVDKGLQAYDALRLAKAIDSGNQEEALAIAQEIALGLATDAIPGNVILVKIGIVLKKFGIVGLGGTLLRKFGGDAAEAGAKFTEGRLKGHFLDHGKQFGAKSAAEYEKMASDFMTRAKPTEVLEKTRASNGDILRYDPKTNEFGVLTNKGVIRTYFKPKRGLEYYNDQH